MTLSDPFTLNWPGNALFGAGRVDDLGTLLAARGQMCALIVTDPGLREVGVLGRVTDALGKGAVAVDVYDRVNPNPTTANVAEARQMWEQGSYDALIALGGGSSIDTAKGAMAEILTGCDAFAALGNDVNTSDRPVPPFYAIPTTSGTGSECSLGCVLKSPERKFVIRGRLLQPTTVIMDPELTLSLPRGMTASTGFDAFCHAIGAFTNNQVNPVADELALASMRLALEHLPTAVEDGSNLEARAGVMMSSYLGGFCIGQKGVDGIHGLCTPVESIVTAVHGQVLGTLLPHVLRYNFETLADRYALIATRLGLKGDPLDAIFDAAVGLATLTDCPERLGAFGLSTDDIPRLTEMALLSQATQRNGRPMPASDVSELYEAMI
ncbi:iron-containing alcohol dehydrogenase family protein [Chachezhania sediminis]|uniref:iron-containing alcohol dehydrogenase family protein n=1 Tax=Chachezhania sediminis TaxID=2599291 RepID=UPI00131BA3BB|nr:iron-containing alcohol dehydrogenase [Chachezhania sediminis]